jgi:hypothetical protein
MLCIAQRRNRGSMFTGEVDAGHVRRPPITGGPAFALLQASRSQSAVLPDARPFMILVGTGHTSSDR